MKIKEVNQKNKSGVNIVAENIQGNIYNIQDNKKITKDKERIALEDNKEFHNFNLKLYGLIFEKFGFLRSSIGFGASSIISSFYLYQAYYLKWFSQTYVELFFILLLAYSLYFFIFLLNRSCPNCKAKFSLYKIGTYKVGECKIEGIPYDINKINYRCINCKRVFVEEEKVEHRKKD